MCGTSDKFKCILFISSPQWFGRDMKQGASLSLVFGKRWAHLQDSSLDYADYLPHRSDLNAIFTGHTVYILRIHQTDCHRIKDEHSSRKRSPGNSDTVKGHIASEIIISRRGYLTPRRKDDKLFNKPGADSLSVRPSRILLYVQRPFRLDCSLSPPAAASRTQMRPREPYLMKRNDRASPVSSRC